MKLPRADERSKLILFKGGLDVTTPPIDKPPGMVIDAANFEQDLNGGYNTIEGYERFDGHPKPHLAEYAILHTMLTVPVNVGDVITDATGTVIATVIAYTQP